MANMVGGRSNQGLYRLTYHLEPDALNKIKTSSYRSLYIKQLKMRLEVN